MKKLICILVIALMSATSFAQSVFDQLENMDGVSSVIVNKDAFELISKFNPSGDNEAVQIFSMIQQLKELRFFKSGDSKVAAKMEAMVVKTVKKFKMTELMRAKDKGAHVRIYVRAGKKKDFVDEVLMFVKGVDAETKESGVEAVIVSLTGVIDVNKLSDIADAVSNK